MLRFGILRVRVSESPGDRFPTVLRPDLKDLKPVVGAEVHELESGYFPFSTLTGEPLQRRNSRTGGERRQRSRSRPTGFAALGGRRAGS